MVKVPYRKEWARGFRSPPIWHHHSWPHWLRMVLLGEAPWVDEQELKQYFGELDEKDRTKEMASFGEQKAELEDTLKSLSSRIIGTFAAVSIVSAGIGFSVTIKSRGVAAGLLIVSVLCMAAAVATLMRGLMPRLRVFTTNYMEPRERAKSSRTPEQAYVISYKLVWRRSHTAQFLKRLLVVACLLGILGLMFFLAFVVKLHT